MKVFKCDRCGNIFEDKNKLSNYNVSSIITAKGCNLAQRVELDLCPQCEEELTIFMNNKSY